MSVNCRLQVGGVSGTQKGFEGAAGDAGALKMALPITFLSKAAVTIKRLRSANILSSSELKSEF